MYMYKVYQPSLSEGIHSLGSMSLSPTVSEVTELPV